MALTWRHASVTLAAYSGRGHTNRPHPQATPTCMKGKVTSPTHKMTLKAAVTVARAVELLNCITGLWLMSSRLMIAGREREGERGIKQPH